MTEWTKDEQKEHRRLWVEALRSGKYQQATDDLRDDAGGFCCLGVACDISDLGAWDNDNRYVTDGGFRHTGELDYKSDMTLWLGLATGAGSFGPEMPTGRESLAHLNDAGKSFSEIADIIESEPEGLLSP